MSELVPLKRIVRINPETLPEDTASDFEFQYVDIGSVGRGRLVEELGVIRFGDAPSRARRVLRPGDTIVSTVRTYLRAVLHVEESGLIGSTGFACLRPRANVFPRFLGWWTQSDEFIEEVVARSVGVSYPAINPSEIGLMRFPMRPVAEQRAIADFLDTETARIDALITKKMRMRRLLEERWEQVVRQTLHDLDAPVLPLKRRWQVLDCKHRTPTYTEEGYPVVSPGDATPGRLDLSRCSRFVGEEDFRDLTEGGRKPVRGTIIYSRNASIGIACYVDTNADVTMGQDVCLIKSTDQDQLYLTYALNSIGVDQLEEQKIGSTFSRVNISQIVDLKIPAPDPEVQRQLARRFDAERARTDQLASKLGRQVGLLREHRQALITAAVTGELEVPGVAA